MTCPFLRPPPRLNGYRTIGSGFRVRRSGVAPSAGDQTRLISISRDEVDSGLIESERRILRAEAIQSGKPEKVVDKIVEQVAVA